ncbi:MAG: glycosyltransferase [Erysipelotrichaceae bacterium]|nr:glycosyltransferase [Erysipelotrichaceae bacterium]
MSSKKTRLNHFLAAHRADLIITLTQSDKEAWINKYHLKENQFQVIHNYNVPKETEEVTRTNTIITVGSYDPVKGYEYLVEVAKRVLMNTEYTWHLYAMGENEYKQKILTLIHENNLEDKLIVEKPLNDLSRVYKTAKTNVMTSRNEGLPLSLIEAKQYGCVNVAFDCKTGPSEIIKDGIDGYVISCYEVETMANKVIALMQDESLRNTFSEHALEDKRFEKNQVISLWKETLLGVLGK